MDKATRMLNLYTCLKEGKRVKKSTYCNDTGCSSRTFDRDINGIRNFLSEKHEVLDLAYDKESAEYYLREIIGK